MRTISTLLLLFMLLILSASTAFATSGTTSITLTDIQMVDNNHVGNEWSTTAKIGKKEVLVGDTITVKSKSAVKLFAEASENDRYPDVGTKSKTISPNKYLGKKIILRVVVVEDRGRYAGNSATWEFTYSIE